MTRRIPCEADRPYTAAGRIADANLILAAFLVSIGFAHPAAAIDGDTASDVFHGADIDHDGRLSEQEFEQLSSAPDAGHDASGKGLPATEHQAQALRNFKDQDIDGDGYISADELTGGKPR